MREIFQTRAFKKDIRRSKKRGKDLAKLKAVVALLIDGRDLPQKHRDHPLHGVWAGSRDCHIEPDWILIYRADDESLYLERTGTHADLFK